VTLIPASAGRGNPRLAVCRRSVQDMADRWVASEEANPVRRIAFGSPEQADRFAATLPGWSVVDNDDPCWLPMVGETGGPKTYSGMPTPE